MTARDLDLLTELRRLTANGTAMRLRQENRLTRAEVAAAVGIGYRRFQNWELGLRTPHGPEAVRYARLLDRLAERQKP